MLSVPAFYVQQIWELLQTLLIHQLFAFNEARIVYQNFSTYELAITDRKDVPYPII